MVEKIHGTRTELLLKRCFDAIKYDNINENFQLQDMNLKIKYQLDKNLNVKKKNQLRLQAKKVNKNYLDLL